VFRRIPNEAPTLEQLALPAGVRRLVGEHHGLILVTGPTGSRKSTTLAANVAMDRHDFMLALDHELKRRAAMAADVARDSEDAREPEPEPLPERPFLRTS
jgi:hypothetical protein